MWTRHKNHMVWTDPWVYVALPNQEIEYFQMKEPEDAVPRQRWVGRFLRAYAMLKTLAIL